MSARDAASLAYKLAGVYALVQALGLLPPILTSPGYAFAEDTHPSVMILLVVLGNAIPLVLMAALGVFLLLKSQSLADRTVGDTTRATAGISGREIHAILFSVIGVLLVGIAAPKIPSAFRIFAVLAADYGEYDYEKRAAALLRDNWLWLSGVGLQLIIGGVMLFRARQLVSMLRRGSRGADALTDQCPHCGHPFVPTDYRSDARKFLCAKCQGELPPELIRKGE